MDYLCLCVVSLKFVDDHHMVCPVHNKRPRHMDGDVATVAGSVVVVVRLSEAVQVHSSMVCNAVVHM